ncbi:MAG: histidine kinase [Cyclobacteriaceae bacterium]|jgi:two-component sensor histidine kinase|nr:histidine kinase [Cyclobacteriaceae bacterium]
MLGYKKRKDFYLVYGVIFTLSIVGFFVRLPRFSQFTLQAHIAIYFVSIFLIVFVWESIRNIDRYLNKALPFEKNIPLRITVQLLAGALIGLLVRLFLYYYGEPQLPFKLDDMFAAATWVLYILLPEVITLGFITYHLIARWQSSVVQNERLEREKAQVQFDNLKNQLNPHFLFNALSSLNSLIMENQRLASEFVQQLSRVYRYVLQYKDQSSVSLSTELNFIQHYISLLQTRFQQALTITVAVDKEAEEQRIVPVTLQILIENAIKHNIVSAELPLHIEIFTSGDYLVVSNNLQQRKHVESSNKLGLKNMQSLYKFLSDKPVQIEQTAIRFSVKVPLL